MRDRVLAASLILFMLEPHVQAERPSPPTVTVPLPSPAAAAGVGYEDVTSMAGLGSFRHVSGSVAKEYILEATGSGVALLDYNGDGWLDVYLVNGGTFEDLRAGKDMPPAALFKNRGDGTFDDVTSAAGVGNGRWGQG